MAPVFIRIVPTVLYARKTCNMAWTFCLFNDAVRLWLHGGVGLATCNENGVSVQLIRPGSSNVLDPRRRIVIESDWSPIVASRSLSVVYVPDDDIHDAPFFLTRDQISRISDSDVSTGKMTSTSGTSWSLRQPRCEAVQPLSHGFATFLVRSGEGKVDAVGNPQQRSHDPVSLWQQCLSRWQSQLQCRELDQVVEGSMGHIIDSCITSCWP